MSEKGCPVRKRAGLCRQVHGPLANPDWQKPHHSDTAAPGPSPKRIAVIRRAMASDEWWGALDAAEADNARLRAALAPFVKWYALLLLMGWQEETPLGLAPSVSYPLGSRPNIGDLHWAAAAYGPLPKVET